MQTEMQLVMNVHAKLAKPVPVGGAPGNELTIIPIIGGSFEGPGLHGRVCPGGADWNTRRSKTVSHALARYWLETDDGIFISVRNEGKLDATSGARFQTVPTFEVDAQSPYSFLRTGVFVGELHPGKEPDSVDLVFYRVK